MYSISIYSMAFVNCLKLAEMSVRASISIDTSDSFLCGVHMSIKNGEIKTLFASNNHSLILYNNNTFKGVGSSLGEVTDKNLNFLTLSFNSKETIRKPDYKAFLKNLSDIRSIYNWTIKLDVCEDLIIYKIGESAGILPFKINKPESRHLLSQCEKCCRYLPIRYGICFCIYSRNAAVRGKRFSGFSFFKNTFIR